MVATAAPESGTKDKNYDLITVTDLCLEHVWRLASTLRTPIETGTKNSPRSSVGCKRLLAQRLREERQQH
jgi:hypothetical protein